MLATDLPPSLIRFFAFSFGAIWGSFFNVAIYRWPRELSVVSPASRCPGCGEPIPPWRNIPILSWLLLRGKAACCGMRISPRYVLVEVLGGVLCLAIAERLILGADPGASLGDVGIETLLYFAFAGGLLVATFVDLEFMEIPDEVSLPLAALGLATVMFRDLPGAENAALGAGGGFLLVQLVFVWSYERLTGRRGMGEGDAKLLMAIGAFLGWRGALFSLIAGAFQGVAVTLGSMLAGRPLGPPDAEETAEDDDAEPGEIAPSPTTEPGEPLEGEHEEDEEEPLKIPFGPFLALGALEFFFFGDLLIERYLALFQ
ncbi:MAG: prepilin peptidase [Deltaproteobacteria bacterium]|nr:prepilin peptidase [Deltaproteobacteria bacterium]